MLDVAKLIAAHNSESYSNINQSSIYMKYLEFYIEDAKVFCVGDVFFPPPLFQIYKVNYNNLYVNTMNGNTSAVQNSLQQGIVAENTQFLCLDKYDHKYLHYSCSFSKRLVQQPNIHNNSLIY